MSEIKHAMTVEYCTQKHNEPLPNFALHSLQVYHIDVHPVRLPARNAVFTVQRALPAFLKQLTSSPLSGWAIRAQTFACPFLPSSPRHALNALARRDGVYIGASSAASHGSAMESAVSSTSRGKVEPVVGIGADFEGKGFRSTSNMVHNHPVMIVDRGLPLRL